jgi:hypothetical protein
MYEFECCTQAMMFRRGELVNKLLDYIEARFDESPVDWLIRDFIKENQGENRLKLDLTLDVVIYMKHPNVFQHIGEYSSLDEKANHIIHTSQSYEDDPTGQQSEIEKVNYVHIKKT